MSNTVNLILIFAIFIMVSLFFYQLFCVTTEESIVLSAIFVMVGVFLTAFIGKAEIIYYVLIFMSVFGCIAFIKDFSFVTHEKIKLGKRMFMFINPTVGCLSVLFLYSAVAFRGALFTYPDEIMQWGPAVRHMVETGHLPYGDGFSGQDITLSTATMFQYIWTGFVPFMERNCLIGNFLLTFIPVYLPLSGLQWRDWKKTVFYTVAVFLSFSVLTYVKYYVLLQDLVLPIWTGAIIAWLLWKQEKKLNWWLIWGALMCIGSMKSMVGPLFAGIIIVVLIIRQIIIYQVKMNKVFTMKTVLLSAMTLIATISLSMIWSVLIKANAYNRFIGTNAAEEKDKATIFKSIISRSFVSSTGNTIFPNISFATLCMLIILVMCITHKFFLDEKKRLMSDIGFGLYAIGFIIFMAIMVFAYIYVFGAEDSNLVAGLDRYFAYYMLVGVVPLLSVFCLPAGIVDQKKVVGFRLGVLMILVLGINNAFVDKVSTLNQKQNTTYNARISLREATDRLKELTDSEGRIFVYGILNSETSKMLSWELENQYQWNRDCYQYYQRTMDDLVTFCDIEKYPFLLKERGYDYLWCYSVAGGCEYNLKYRYTMQNLKQGALYKIILSGDKINLKYLGNTQEVK